MSPKSQPLSLSPLIEAVDDELKRWLLQYVDVMPMSQITMGKYALAAPGKVMPAAHELSQGREPSHPPRWPLLVLLSCQACSPAEQDAWRRALPAAVAVEIAMAAADLIDEVTDDDPSPFTREYGVGQALNTGNLMLVMAQQILLRAADHPGGHLALDACRTLQEVLVQAAVGQHLDMLYGDMPPGEVDLEMSVNMSALKAGALVSGACRMGAQMSGAEDEIVDLLTRFGKELGCQAQVLNDIQDVTPRPEGTQAEGEPLPERKTDLRKRKRTLPIVFTLREEAARQNPVQRAFSEPGSEYDEEALRLAVDRAGGIRFASLVAEVHRQHAFEALSVLESHKPGAYAILSPLVPGDSSQ